MPAIKQPIKRLKLVAYATGGRYVRVHAADESFVELPLDSAMIDPNDLNLLKAFLARHPEEYNDIAVRLMDPSETLELTTSEERVTMDREMRPFPLNSEEAGWLAGAANDHAAKLKNIAQGYTKGSPTEQQLIARADLLNAVAKRLNKFADKAPPTVQQLAS
jgi:hypothetical protein